MLSWPTNPSPPRMYTGILRQDFTPEETAALQQSEPHRNWFEKIKADVWHPTSDELLLFAIHPKLILDADLRQDIAFHLHQDRCVECRNLVG